MIELPVGQVNEICLHGKGYRQCMYLAKIGDTDKFCCVKVMPVQKEIIDSEVSFFKATVNKDVYAALPPMPPIGDNCDGFNPDSVVGELITNG